MFPILQAPADTAAIVQPGAEPAAPVSTAALLAGLVLVLGIALWLWYRRRRSTL